MSSGHHPATPDAARRTAEPAQASGADASPQRTRTTFNLDGQGPLPSPVAWRRLPRAGRFQELGPSRDPYWPWLAARPRVCALDLAVHSAGRASPIRLALTGKCVQIGCVLHALGFALAGRR